MLKVLITLILLGMVVLGIIKKLNIPTVLLFATIIGFIIITIMNKASVMGDKTIGNSFLDIFEKMYTSFKSTIAGNVLTIMTLLGYVNFMNSIKASDMFAMLIAAPLQKLKAPYFLAAMVILLGALMKIVVPSAISVVALLAATLYPVLRQIGCSKATCASAIAMSVVFCWGPADASMYTALSLMEITDVSVSVWFVTNQIPVNICMIAVAVIVFLITAKMFDKKENAGDDSAQVGEAKSAKELGVPYYYAILPLLPLVLILVFSELILGSIVISVVAATYVSLLVAFLVHLATKRKFVECVNSVQTVYDGMGQFVRTSGILLIYGTAFASMLSAVGGMKIIITSLTGFGGSYFMLVIISFLGLLMVALTGTYNGNLSIVIPFTKTLVELTGINSLGATFSAILGLGIGFGFTPVSGANIFVAGACDTDIMVMIKRNAVPLIASWIAGIAVSLIFFV